MGYSSEEILAIRKKRSQARSVTGDSGEETVDTDASSGRSEKPRNRWSAVILSGWRVLRNSSADDFLHPQWTGTKQQVLGVVGAVVLSLGTFAPIFSVPILGNPNYFGVGRRDGRFILMFAVLTLILALNRKYQALRIPGVGSLGLITFTLIRLQVGLAQVKSEMAHGLEGDPFRGLAEVAIQRPQLEWGWVPLVAGAVLILCAAFMREESEKTWLLFPAIVSSMRRLTLAISAVVALGITSWLLLASFGFFKGDLTGSVFIVTRGGQNVKLGLVEVRAIPEREIRSFIQEKQTVAKKQQDELQPVVGEAEQQAQEAEDEYKKRAAESAAALDNLITMTMAGKSWEQYEQQHEQLERIHDAASKRWSAASEASTAKGHASTEKSLALRKLKAKYSHWTSCNYYFDGLPVGVTSTKTDADGAFSLRLRRGVKYALAAKARREVMDDTEEYYWLVWVTLGGRQTNMFLSNDNLLTSGSVSSVVTATN